MAVVESFASGDDLGNESLIADLSPTKVTLSCMAVSMG